MRRGNQIQGSYIQLIRDSVPVVAKSDLVFPQILGSEGGSSQPGPCKVQGVCIARSINSCEPSNRVTSRFVFAHAPVDLAFNAELEPIICLPDECGSVLYSNVTHHSAVSLFRDQSPPSSEAGRAPASDLGLLSASEMSTAVIPSDTVRRSQPYCPPVRRRKYHDVLETRIETRGLRGSADSLLRRAGTMMRREVLTPLLQPLRHRRDDLE